MTSGRAMAAVLLAAIACSPAATSNPAPPSTIIARDGGPPVDVALADAGTPVPSTVDAGPAPPLPRPGDLVGGPRTRQLRVRRLPTPPQAGPTCALADALSRLGNCVAVAAASAAATEGDPRALFDGDSCTRSTAVNRPYVVRGMLEAPSVISGVLLVPDANLSGHSILLDEEGWSATAPFEPGGLYFVVFDRAAPTRSLTLGMNDAGPGAWREILPFHCTGGVVIPGDAVEVSAKTPEPRPRTPADVRRFVPGTGACTSDADCVPKTCCHAKTCTARPSAPSCAGVTCTADVQPGTLDVGRCQCNRGRCGGLISFPDVHEGGLL